MRRLLPLLVLALVALALPASAPAKVVSSDWTVTVTVGPAKTPCKIVGRTWRDNALADAVPVVLGTNGFGGSRDDFNQLGAAYAATKRYVFVAYSGLGFGGSECKITLDDPDWDGQGASQLIDRIGGKLGSGAPGIDKNLVKHDAPASARIGMIGGSYGGEVQFAAASRNPGLDTIVPQITWNDLAYSLAPNNTGFARGVTNFDTPPKGAPGTEKQTWVNLFFGLGTALGLQAIAQGDTTKAGPCVNFADQACVGKAEMDSTGYPSQTTIDFARDASVTSYMDKIRVPVYLAQGRTTASSTSTRRSPPTTPCARRGRRSRCSGAPTATA